jgi:DNA-binding NtrC family response regulator
VEASTRITEPAQEARVLVVERSEEMRRMLVFLLGRDGIKVATAADGEEGLRLLQRGGGTEVIVVEVRPLDHGKLALLEWVAHHLPAARVVLTTVHGDSLPLTRARELGVAAVLRRPFELADLLQTVRRLLPAGARVA